MINNKYVIRYKICKVMRRLDIILGQVKKSKDIFIFFANENDKLFLHYYNLLFKLIMK